MIKEFRGSTRWLSNFWLIDVVFEGLVYPSTENAYQAAKTLDQKERRRFLNISPGKAKKLGSEIVLRSDWEEIKIPVMTIVTNRKYMEGSFLAEKLIDTGDQILIEGNNWNDTFWGKCNGFGQNNLGKIIMTRREYLINL